LKQEARFAGVNRKDGDAIRDDVYKKVRELGIPARREDIHVESVAPFNVRIWLDYSVPVDLRVYQLQLQFHPKGDSSSL
jgi:nitric oxide synthase oxygenase domain/subunit